MEYKFRGKRKSDGKWFYGFYYAETENSYGGHFIIERTRLKSGDFQVNNRRVSPETVGMFTGLLDKNGAEVYAGDIIKIIQRYREYEDDDDDEMQYRVLIGEITLERGYFTFRGSRWVIYDWHFYNDKDLEVIGNVYDNRELLNQ